MPETATIVSNFISQFGYPIAVSLIAFWYIYKTNQQYRVDIKEIRQEHGIEVHTLSEAVNNNTLVMQKLLDKLGGDKFEDEL